MFNYRPRCEGIKNRAPVEGQLLGRLIKLRRIYSEPKCLTSRWHEIEEMSGHGLVDGGYTRRCVRMAILEAASLEQVYSHGFKNTETTPGR